jgi:hypothetical protein
MSVPDSFTRWAFTISLQTFSGVAEFESPWHCDFIQFRNFVRFRGRFLPSSCLSLERTIDAASLNEVCVLISGPDGFVATFLHFRPIFFK